MAHFTPVKAGQNRSFRLKCLTDSGLRHLASLGQFLLALVLVDQPIQQDYAPADAGNVHLVSGQEFEQFAECLLPDASSRGLVVGPRVVRSLTVGARIGKVGGRFHCPDKFARIVESQTEGKPPAPLNGLAGVVHRSGCLRKPVRAAEAERLSKEHQFQLAPWPLSVLGNVQVDKGLVGVWAMQ